MSKDSKSSKKQADRAARLDRAREEDAEAEAMVSEGGHADDTNGPDGSRKQHAEQVVQAAAEMVRIVVDVSVNGVPAGQRLTVDRHDPFYGGLLDQNLAHIEKDKD